MDTITVKYTNRDNGYTTVTVTEANVNGTKAQTLKNIKASLNLTTEIIMDWVQGNNINGMVSL